MVSTLGGVVGFGTAVLTLPALTAVLGLRLAIPAVTIGMIFANLGRVIAGHRDIDWRIVKIYGIPTLIGGVIGALGFVELDTTILSLIIGIFLLISVPARHRLAKAGFVMPEKNLAIVGTVSGTLSGLGGAVGPVSTPFLLAAGLNQGRLVSTEAACAFGMQGVKAGTYALGGVFSNQALLVGVEVGLLMMLGSFAGRYLLDRLDKEKFSLVVDAAIMLAGCYMIYEGFQ